MVVVYQSIHASRKKKEWEIYQRRDNSSKRILIEKSFQLSPHRLLILLIILKTKWSLLHTRMRLLLKNCQIPQFFLTQVHIHVLQSSLLGPSLMVARMQKNTWGQEPVPVSSDSEMYSSEDSSSEDRSGYLDEYQIPRWILDWTGLNWYLW